MSLYDTFVKAISPAVDRQSEFFQALIGKEEFTPTIPTTVSSEINCGALCNELEWARRATDYFVASMQLGTAEGDELETLVDALVDLPRRNVAETDETYRDRFRFLLVARSNDRRLTRWSILDSVSYFIDLQYVQLLEFFDISNLFFELRLEGSTSYDDALFVQQGYLDQDFIGGLGVGASSAIISQLLHRIKAAGVDYVIRLVQQFRFTKLSDAIIGRVRKYIGVAGHIRILGTVTKTIDAEVTT